MTSNVLSSRTKIIGIYKKLSVSCWMRCLVKSETKRSFRLSVQKSKHSLYGHCTYKYLCCGSMLYRAWIAWGESGNKWYLIYEHYKQTSAYKQANCSCDLTHSTFISCNRVYLRIFQNVQCRWIQNYCRYVQEDLVVQWIEHAPPVLVSWIRIPAGLYRGLEKWQFLRPAQSSVQRWWVGGCKGKVHALCCHELATNAAFIAKLTV